MKNKNYFVGELSIIELDIFVRNEDSYIQPHYYTFGTLFIIFIIFYLNLSLITEIDNSLYII